MLVVVARRVICLLDTLSAFKLYDVVPFCYSIPSVPDSVVLNISVDKFGLSILGNREI